MKKTKVKKNWQEPKVDKEGYKAVAFFYKNGVVELDFFNEKKADFFSEYDEQSIEIDYPFIDGYKPTVKDYEDLGFIVLYE